MDSLVNDSTYRAFVEETNEAIRQVQEKLNTVVEENTALKKELAEVRTVLSAEDVEGAKKQAYMDWWPQTLAAYQQSITEIIRVHTNNATVDVVTLAALRALMDKGQLTLEEISALTDAAQQIGLELIGISFQNVDPNAELSAEERYQHEGLEEWDGQSISHS